MSIESLFPVIYKFGNYLWITKYLTVFCFVRQNIQFNVTCGCSVGDK